MKYYPCKMLFLCIVFFGALSLLCACAGPDTAQKASPPLRVGVTPDYPPLVFKENGEIKGIEADFARAAGETLGRPVVFKEMAFGDLIPALMNDSIDVIMTGMSVTDERKQLLRFIQPYLTVGQMGIIHRDRMNQLAIPSQWNRKEVRVGYVSNTTGESYARTHLSAASLTPLTSADQGLQAVRTHWIDVFIHDAPTAWLLAENRQENDLIPLYSPLTTEPLAWAVSKQNSYLCRELENLLSEWKTTGRLDSILARWIHVTVTVR